MKSGLRWGDVATGGSVATNVFSLLYKIGLKTIILVGQDLALTGNKSHADGTFEEKCQKSIQQITNGWKVIMKKKYLQELIFIHF